MKTSNPISRRLAGVALAAAIAASPLHAASALVVEPVGAEGLGAAIEAERGKVVVLNFWATWCEPCREEFPDLVRFARENEGRVALLTVSLDEPDQGSTSVRKFLERMKAPGRAFIKAAGDPDAFIESVDPAWSGALPATFIHAPDGARAHAIHGPITYARLRELADPILPRK